MNKTLPDNKRTQDKLEKMPKIYLISQCRSCFTNEYRFAGKYIKEKRDREIVMIPLVWHYEESGSNSKWVRKPLFFLTQDRVIFWTFSRKKAEDVAQAMNINFTRCVECEYGLNGKCGKGNKCYSILSGYCSDGRMTF